VKICNTCSVSKVRDKLIHWSHNIWQNGRQCLSHISEIIPFLNSAVDFRKWPGNQEQLFSAVRNIQRRQFFYTSPPPPSPPHPDTSVSLVFGGSGFVPTVETGLLNICSRNMSSVTHRKTKKGTRCWRKSGEGMGEDPNHAWCDGLVLCSWRSEANEMIFVFSPRRSWTNFSSVGTRRTPPGCATIDFIERYRMILKEIITVRGQSYVLHLLKYWPPIPFSARRVCTPRLCCGGRTHSPGGEGGQYFGIRKTQLCTLPISNPLWISQWTHFQVTLSQYTSATIYGG